MLLRLTILLFVTGFINYYSFAIDLSQQAEKGEAIFLQKCASCHTVGKGKLVGPDLKGVTERREINWLKSFIKDPQKLFNSKDKVAVELLKEYNIQMPSSGLSDNNIELVIEFLKSQSETMGGILQDESKEVSSGDIDKGKALFTGMEKLKNGGPACISCHTIAGIEIPGGVLGPVLTKAGETYGKDGLSSVLKDIPFPTMQPVYAGKPITDDEIANLTEFIGSVATSNATPKSFKSSAFLIFAGIIIFVAAMQIAWGGRLKNVRKTLVNKSMLKEEK